MAYRWKAETSAPLRCRCASSTTPGTWQTIEPTTQWKTMRDGAEGRDDVEVATDLYCVGVKSRQKKSA